MVIFERTNEQGFTWILEQNKTEWQTKCRYNSTIYSAPVRYEKPTMGDYVADCAFIMNTVIRHLED